MNQVMIDLWPYLLPPLILAVGWLFREIYALKTKVTVAEKALVTIKESMQSNIENIQKTIDNMQKRQDSHSKKQDEIVKLITDLKVDFVKEIGSVSTNVAAMASNIDNLTNLIKVTDLGIKVDRSTK